MICYDISSDKLRNRFSRFLDKYGYRLQYSVYKIKNSKRVLAIIQAQIENSFRKSFGDEDNVMLFEIDESKIIKYGYIRHESEQLIIID